MQLSLPISEDDNVEPKILGLTYIPDFITQGEENTLIAIIDAQPWLNDLKRRVQHYGYKYDYKARSVTKESYLGVLPNWIQPLAQKLRIQNLFKPIPDQAIVNEYLPG